MQNKLKPVLSHAIMLLALLVVGQSGAAYGFESDEHDMLGNTAIKVLAEEYGCFNYEMKKEESLTEIKDQVQDRNQKICSALIKTLIGDVPSYGAIVAHVDDFMTPEKLIAECTEQKNGLPTQWSSVKCAEKSTKWLQATHNNHTHFQQELLISLSMYHSLALSLAKDKHNLEGALFVNAISDHYLHDFFAPGHITTPRSKLTDLFSNAMHDAANSKGATFHLKKGEGFDKLTIEMLKIKEISINPASQPSIAKFLCGKSTCESIDLILMEEMKMMLKGDGFLMEDDSSQQRLLMLAANVLSIKDVLNAFENEKYPVANSLEPTNWEDSPGRGFNHDITAGLPFGNYSMGPCATENKDVNLPIFYGMVGGVSIAKELFNANQRIARTAFSIETVPIGYISNGIFGNGGISVGYYHYEGDGQVKGNGVLARIGLIVPETETTLSFGIRRVHHTGTAQDGWKNGYSLRLDQGFTSFLSLYLSVGKDYAAPTGGMLAQGSYFAAGVLLAFPTSKITNCLSNVSHCLGK